VRLAEVRLAKDTVVVHLDAAVAVAVVAEPVVDVPEVPVATR
jgi:hypothetical protein